MSVDEPDSVTFDVTYTERRSRLTTAFRYLLAMPHLIFAGLWGYAANSWRSCSGS